jgi:hypothetical protein
LSPTNLQKHNAINCNKNVAPLPLTTITTDLGKWLTGKMVLHLESHLVNSARERKEKQVLIEIGMSGVKTYTFGYY